jgi:Family of unknown function (DUF6105)
MKYVVAIWAAPLVLFWGWYFLSLNDINFGTVYLTRQLHELVFQLYGKILGVEPGSIPGMIAEACFFDTLLVIAIWAVRRRREIDAWAEERWQRYFGGSTDAVQLEAQPEEPSA